MRGMGQQLNRTQKISKKAKNHTWLLQHRKKRLSGHEDKEREREEEENEDREEEDDVEPPNGSYNASSCNSYCSYDVLMMAR